MTDLNLSTPYTFATCGIETKNRLVKAAMVEGMSSLWTGEPNDMHVRLYDRWAQAGYGILISGNVCIDSTHLGTPGDLRVPASLDEQYLGPWRRLASGMTRDGTLGILQLVHTGRQSVRCAGRLPWVPPKAPSATRVSTGTSSWSARLVERLAFQTAVAMDQADIDNVVANFVKGARLAMSAGLNGVELHASHGYLLSQFLSPKTNIRLDQYGGLGDGRLKIILDIVDAVRQHCPRPFVLGIKINSADYVTGGLTEEEALQHIANLARHGGLDFIEISGGSYESVAFLDQPKPPSGRTAKREALFARFCSQAKRTIQEAGCTNPPTILCTGGFRSDAGMLDALHQDGIDLIGIGRPSVVDPGLARRVLLTEKTEGQTLGATCISYKVTGGQWLQALFPSALVGANLETIWHQLQMYRLARDHRVMPHYSLERLLVGEIICRWHILLIVVIPLLAVVAKWAS